MRSHFRINVASLLRNGDPRPAAFSVAMDALFVTGSEVPPGGEVDVTLTLIPVGQTVEVRGTVRAPWQGSCRRCLQPAVGVAEGDVLEVFENPPVDGETYPLEHDEIDLELLVRETVMLELPQAPLCREDCQGLCPHCGVDRNESTCSCNPPLDPRWAVLEELREATDREES